MIFPSSFCLSSECYVVTAISSQELNYFFSRALMAFFLRKPFSRLLSTTLRIPFLLAVYVFLIDAKKQIWLIKAKNEAAYSPYFHSLVVDTNSVSLPSCSFCFSVFSLPQFSIPITRLRLWKHRFHNATALIQSSSPPALPKILISFRLSSTYLSKHRVPQTEKISSASHALASGISSAYTHLTRPLTCFLFTCHKSVWFLNHLVSLPSSYHVTVFSFVVTLWHLVLNTQLVLVTQNCSCQGCTLCPVSHILLCRS